MSNVPTSTQNIITQESIVDTFINTYYSNQDSKMLPFVLFDHFFNQAKNHKNIKDATTFCLATSQNNIPDARILLLKHFDSNGFVFFTNKNSKKGQQLTSNPNAAMCFYWDEIGIQVRIRGSIINTTDADSDKYFASRSLESRLGAVVSQQSTPIKDRAQFTNEYNNAYNHLLASNLMQTQSNITRPPHWGGYCLVPSEIEFWHDRPFRLHDRTVFTLDKACKHWSVTKIYP